MEEYIINRILYLSGYQLEKNTQLKKLSNTNYYIPLQFNNQLALDYLVDQIEEFKLNYPQIIEYLKIDIDDNNTTDFVNNIKVKIIFEFKELTKIDQMAAYLKLV